MTLKKNYLEKLSSNQLLNLAEFVVTENFKHHSDDILPENYKKNIQSIYKEELKYFKDSRTFVAKNHFGTILGSIRVLKWNYIDNLPLQNIFGINPLLISNDASIKDIWHIGRFAIKKEVRDINLFKQLLVCAIYPMCKHEKSIAFAECDSKLLRILTLLGIKATVLGESVNYLGSETIPICMPYDGFINFYNENRSLIPSNILNPVTERSLLPESVVFNKQTFNYPLV